MIMAIDQYGHIQHGLVHPRKDLAERHSISPSSVQKMYSDTKDGESVHVGYIVQQSWYTLYTVVPWKGKR